MNMPNNRRGQESRKRIETAFIRLLQQQELGELRVTEICRMASVNRTTFYAHFIDVYDLAEAVQKDLEAQVLELYRDEWEQGIANHDFLRLFRHIKENPLFYRTYFKLNREGKSRFMGYDVNEVAARFGDSRYLEYHIEFFRNGLNAVLCRWLQNDCRESPEEISAILEEEYRGVRNP